MSTVSVTTRSPEAAVIEGFVARDLMLHPEGRFVWDLGCGAGSFAHALAEVGARRVLGSDLGLPPGTEDRGCTQFVRGDFDAADAVAGGLRHVDVVFMHLMSEHVLDFKSFMASLFGRLRPGAEVLVHHDNYYQPVGSHDHGLIALNPETWMIEAQGPKCWLLEEKCEASRERRAVVRQRWSQIFSQGSDDTRNPEVCSSCNYFRRSQPWAHLVYGQELRRTFPESFVRTALNRLTPAQVMWDIQDAGFVIAKQERTWIQNPVPEDLAREYGAHTLQTFTLTCRLVRRAD